MTRGRKLRLERRKLRQVSKLDRKSERQGRKTFKAEQYALNPEYRAAIDEKRKKIFAIAGSVVGLAKGLTPMGSLGVVGKIMKQKNLNEAKADIMPAELKTQNNIQSTSVVDAGYTVVEDNKDKIYGINKKILPILAIAAIGLLLILKK